MLQLMELGEMAHCASKTKHCHINHSVKPFLVDLKIVWTLSHQVPVVSNKVASMQRAISAGGLKMIAREV